MSHALTAGESAAIAEFYADGGKAVECPLGAVSANVKFKSGLIEQFAGWELDGWLPGELPYPEPTYHQCRPIYDEDDWRQPRWRSKKAFFI